MGCRVSKSIEKREALYEALVPLADGGRVSKHRPGQPYARPHIWIGLETRNRGRSQRNGAPLVLITYPVVIVGDGASEAQDEQLSRLADAVWQAAERAGFSPMRSTPGEIEQPPAADGTRRPPHRIVTVDVDATVLPSTLCPPTAPPEPAWPVSQPEELTHV